MNPELRKAQLGQIRWTRGQILAGLMHFHELYSRYPTAFEIDKFEYLPSSRSIQRSFGGLVALRSDLIPTSQSDYTRGDYRSKIAKAGNDRAKKYEEEFYNFLCKHFEPIAIHEHKVIRPGNIASDFFIYLKGNEGIVLDLFYAQDIRSVIGVINIKLKRYIALPFKTIFILVGNDQITIETIQLFINRRTDKIPQNITVDTEDNFKVSTINKIKPLSIYSKR